MEDRRKAATVEPDTDVQIIGPDFTLKDKVGGNLDQIFSDKNVNKAQAFIDSHQEAFVDWAVKDLAAMEHVYRHAETTLDKATKEIAKLARTAFSLKAQSGTFGYMLASQVAKSLCDFCEERFEPTDRHMIIVRKHMDILTMIFQKKMTTETENKSHEIMQTLKALIEKYS